MAKFKQKTSQQTLDESMQIAKSTQRPGQTKEQTKLIAQGIQKGIEQYKKKNKSKARDLDKKLKAIRFEKSKETEEHLEGNDSVSFKNKHKMQKSILPWSLLVLSWGFFVFYIFWF